MRILIMLIILSVIANTAIGQRKDVSNYKLFRTSFDKNFKFPAKLKTANASIFAVILLTFKKDGKIDKLLFSDGAPPELISEIERIKEKVNFKAIYDNISINSPNIKVLIPIQVDALRMAGGGNPIPQRDLDKMYLFQGKPILGECFFYPSINLKYYYNNYEKQ
ncbi:hypothetical protein ACR780_07040 [Sphingobacterium faecium]|uniref:hypothetical protein n=1 Tax=Sphingobacterium faecium TaxID=34087 RepID=UPI003DA650D4